LLFLIDGKQYNFPVELVLGYYFFEGGVMCRSIFALFTIFSLAANSFCFAGFVFSGDNSILRVSGGTFNVNYEIAGGASGCGIIDVQTNGTLALTENITTWSGTVKNSGTITGGDKGKCIDFSNGIYECDGVKSLLTTCIFPTVDTNSTFSLVNGDKLEAAPGTMADDIYVGPSNGSQIVEATLESASGYSGNITVSSGATLIMNLQRTLNSNITFSTKHENDSDMMDSSCTGSVKLLNDLKLADGVVLQGAMGCTSFNQGCGVDLNGYSFIWGARGTSGATLTITGSTTWETAGDVVLTGSMALETTWVFNDVNSVLQGNGNVLDMSHASACIEVPKGKSLHLNDIVLKGYSGEKIILKGAYDTANTSTLYFSNVSVHLTGAANNDKGTICVDGPTTVYPQGYLWTISGNAIDDRARLKIDGVTVWLDEGSSSDGTFGFALNYPWAASDYLNSGTIKEVAVDTEDIVLANQTALSNLTGNFAVMKSNGCSFATVPTFTYNYFAGTGNTMNFDSSSASIAVNGASHYVELERGATDVVTIANGTRLTTTFEDIRIKNFSPQAFSVTNAADAIHDLCFGDNTVLELSENIVLNNNLYFEGTVEIHGFGHEIDLSTNSKVLTVTSNNTLKIYNARIKGLQGSASSGYLQIGATNGVVELYNCKIVQSGAYNLDQGTINIYENTKMKGNGTERTFQVSSNGVVAIKSNATLKLDRDMTFDYDVTGGSGGLTIAANGKLHLNGCTFDAAGATSGLTVGGVNNTTLIIEDKVSVIGGPNISNPLLFSSDYLTTIVKNGGVIDIRDGFVELDTVYEPV
jgi:hypothetical protein